MSKNKIATIATVAAAAGAVGMIGQQDLQAQAATTNTPSVASKVSQVNTPTDASQTVSQATSALNTAKAADKQAATDEAAAAANVKSTSDAVNTATAAQQQAEATKKAATPENIANAQATVKTATDAQNQAKTQATATGTALNQAQDAVNDKNNAVNGAQQAVDQAQQVVKSIDTVAAQAAVDQDQSAIDTQTKTVSDAQTAADQANTAANTAQTNADNAQAAVDATTNQLNNMDSRVDVGGVVMPAGYKQAYQNRADAYNNAFDAVFNGDYDDDANVAQAQAAGEAAEAKADAALAAIEKQVIEIDYQPTTADKNTKIDDVSNLTEAQVRELSDFTAAIINDVRGQLGLTPIRVTDGSAKLAYLMINKNEGDGETFGVSGGNNPMVKADVGSQVGIPSDSWDDASTEYNSALATPLEDFAEWGWHLYHTNDQTMATLKGGIADYLYTHLDTRDNTVVTGEQSSRGSVLDMMATEPGNVYSYGNGEDVENYDENSPRDLYLGTTFDNQGKIHVISITDFDHSIPASSTFFNNTQTPAALSHVAVKDSALEATLDTQTQALTAAKATLATAQKDLADKTSSKVSATNALAKLQTQLTTDQATLKEAQLNNATPEEVAQAKAAVVTAKQALTTAQTELTTANQTLATAKTANDEAQAALTTATAKLAKAQAYLDSLENADANLASANQDLAAAQAAYQQAQADYQQKLTVSKSTGAAVKLAEQTLATAKAKLAAETAHAQAVQAIDDLLQATKTKGHASVQPVAVATKHAVGDTINQVTTSLTTAANKAKAANQANSVLPQTGAQPATFLAYLGALLFGLFSLAGVGLKRRRN